MGLSDKYKERIIKEVKEISELIDKVKYFQYFYNDIIKISDKLISYETQIGNYKNKLSLDTEEHSSTVSSDKGLGIKPSNEDSFVKKPTTSDAEFLKAEGVLNKITSQLKQLGYPIEVLKNRIEELKKLLFFPDPLLERIEELKKLLLVLDPSISTGTLGGSRKKRKTRKTSKASKKPKPSKKKTKASRKQKKSKTRRKNRK